MSLTATSWEDDSNSPQSLRDYGSWYMSAMSRSRNRGAGTSSAATEQLRLVGEVCRIQEEIRRDRPNDPPDTGDLSTLTSSRPASRLDKRSTYSQLDRLGELPSDWNGYGAEPVDPTTINVAKALIEFLPDDVVGTPKVVPMTRGRLQFEWHRGNRSLELEFEGPNRIHYLKVDEDMGVDEEDIFPVAYTSRIIELLRWFSAE